jgi:predicted nucleic acid-binding protein
MAAKPPKDRAWDSDALIGWLGKEADKQEICAPVIDACEAGKVRLVVSALAMAEVIKLKRGNAPIPESARELIEGFFGRTFIVARNVDPATSSLARQLVWTENIDPKDAVHVATALRAGVPLLETFDGGLLKLGVVDLSGYKRLTIRQPRIDDEQRDMDQALRESES